MLASRRRNQTTCDDFLSVLMAARYADGTALTDDAIAGLLLTLLFAGQHTSAVMATWLGVLLMQYPAYREALRREAADILGDWCRWAGSNGCARWSIA